MIVEEAKVIMAKRKQCGIRDFYDCKLLHKVSCTGVFTMLQMNKLKKHSIQYSQLLKRRIGMTVEERVIAEIEEAFEQLGCRYNGYYYELIEVTKQALEKQIPKKITEIHCDEYYCPTCGAENNCNQYVVDDEFCPHCGQHLDRS